MLFKKQKQMHNTGMHDSRYNGQITLFTSTCNDENNAVYTIEIGLVFMIFLVNMKFCKYCPSCYYFRIKWARAMLSYEL